jgi:stringent starvation protein B
LNQRRIDRVGALLQPHLFSHLFVMTSTRPYLIRALYEWIGDNALTPHLVVNAEIPGVEVPKQHVQEGRIILNINATAVRDLRLGNDWIEFNARFGGVARTVRVPVVAVLAIYARENGQGMAFGQESEGDEPPPNAPPPEKPTSRTERRPALKIVK